MADSLSQHVPAERELHDHSSGQKTIVLRRRFDAPIERVWEALTSPECLVRWYLPLGGDLREGGYYFLEGNAVGEIQRCDRPHELALTWIYGEFSSDLSVRLLPRGELTLLELQHEPIPLDMIANPTPELWGLAVNWEMLLIGLGEFLDGRTPAGRAVDWMRLISEEERAATAEVARQINEDWLVACGAGG
ncbi:MAG: SRPBCC domain-containing protein [Chloroflexota bacterium]